MSDEDWSGRDESASLREGWFIQVSCYGARIRAVKGGRFVNDAAAVAYVLNRAIKGDELARRAARFLALDHELPASTGLPPDGSSGPILLGGVAGNDDPPR